MFALRVAMFCLTLLRICQTEYINSLNNYGDNSYPDRCVLDMGYTLLMLKYGQSVKLENLPCTQVLCMGEGWGLLQTCSHDPPPANCRYSKFDWSADFPFCCRRHLICD